MFVLVSGPRTSGFFYSLVLVYLVTVTNKHLMTGHKGNSEFCFPETLNEVEGKQNSLFPEGPVIECFVIPPDSKIEKAPKKNYLLEAITMRDRKCQCGNFD